MRRASDPSSYLDAVPLRSRVVSLLLAVGLTLLMIIMIIRLGIVSQLPINSQSRLITFNVIAGSKSPAAHSRNEKQQQRPASEIKSPKPAIRLPTPTAKANGPVPWIEMSSEQFAATDISKIPSHAHDSAGASNSDGTGQDSAAAYGPGEGPNGERLYNADWYREPGDAELATYMPRGLTPPAWAMIACRTIDHFHVEDCRELAESPPGSGLARALRQAAWQFLVRPPRLGGKPLIGAWVRIRFDITEGGARARRG